MSTAAKLLLAFVALYPVCTAALWIAGVCSSGCWRSGTLLGSPKEVGRA